MNRNDSPRLTNKLYEIIKDIVTNKDSLDNFSSDFIESLENDEEIFVIKLIFKILIFFYKKFIFIIEFKYRHN